MPSLQQSGPSTSRPVAGRAREWLASALFLVGLSLAAHFAYSWMGFNPTDDGFYLALARRLIEGQVPHLDFIAYQPVGSALLHAPFVILGGDHTFWFSRLFVWFEFATIAWAWVAVADRLGEARLGLGERTALALIAFVFSSHYFPPMAWSTIDGLFFVAVGLVLCLSQSARWRFAGYLLIGVAYLCKQNYLLLAPAAVLAFGDQRKAQAWAAALAPGVLYALVLGALGALPDAIVQLTAQTSLIDVGVKRYLWEYGFPWGIVLGYLAVRVARPAATCGPSAPPGTAAVVTMLLPLSASYAALVAATFSLATGRYLWVASFGLFGLALGSTLYVLLERDDGRGAAKLGLLSVLAAWSASISVGYNTPALGTGVLVVAVLVYNRLALLRLASSLDGAKLCHGLRVLAVSVLLIGAVANSHSARRSYVYLDRPADQLTQSLAGVFPGMHGVMTGGDTHAVLVDLQRAIDLADGRPYAIVPDFAGYWVKAAATNPLPIDWPVADNLVRPELVDRVLDRLDAGRGKAVVIVQKFKANALARGVQPLPASSQYLIANHVRENFDKLAESEYFAVYE